MPSTQALGALLFLISGFAFGLAFDLYRVVRRLSDPGRWLTITCDFLFWLVYTVWIFALLQRVNAGEVRFYVFLCIGAGAALYFWLLSRHMARAWYIVLYRLVRAISWVANLINRALEACVRVVLWPYHLVERSLVSPILRILRVLLNPFFVLENWLEHLLLGWWTWLTRPFRRLISRFRRAIAEFFTPPKKES